MIQAIEFSGAAFFFVSYQVKSNKALFAAQIRGCLSFSLQFALPGHTKEFHQMTFFDMPGKEEEDDAEHEAALCRIYDWRAKNSLPFRKLKEM